MFGGIQRRRGAHVRLARADERLVDNPQAAHAVGLASRFQRLERVDLVRRRCATISLPQRWWGTPCAAQNSYSIRAPSTQCLAFSVPAG